MDAIEWQDNPQNCKAVRTNGPTALVITVIALGVIASTFVCEYKSKHPQSYKVIDLETVSIVERKPVGKVYIRAEHRYFYPGDTLTSKENGALILWDTTMPRSWIIGVVSDSGTIEPVTQ